MAASRVAVVSGASGGIGRALAQGFLAAGHQVIGVDRAATDWSPENFRAVRLDVTDGQAVAAFGAGLERVDVLVNAAGVLRRHRELDPATFVEVVDTNLVGTMRLSVACHPALAAARGAVINVASMYAYFGAPHAPAYAASKGAVAQFTRSLAVAWAGEGIRVNALAPGWIETAMTEGARADEERARMVLARTPMGRWGEPSDLVGPALFLASGAAGFVTGVVLPVDGGYLVA